MTRKYPSGCTAKKYFESDEQLKKHYKKEYSQNSSLNYPIKTLQEYGFIRKQCKCGQYFWTVDEKRTICGEPVCAGGFGFIGKSPCTKQLDFIQVWEEYSKIHKELGYTPIKRYPVVARWNPTTEFTIASIAAFQPYVVSGEVEPPSAQLVIPQFCLRFPDIDNVGITGHFTGFVMLGEHAFLPPEEYNTNKFLKDHLIWLTKGMGLPLNEITVHEDVWAGGGNFGPCLEFFVKGLEVSNQVYMQYENTSNGAKELKIKVLDMGQGHERAAWITQGTTTAYEATFPTVIEKLKTKTGIEIDNEFMKKFIHLAAYLNVLEFEDIEKQWQTVAEKLNITTQDLKHQIEPIAALYSIAEHSRALLVALTDGALPSNVGGMYNLRVLYRRAQGFIDKYGWGLDLTEICSWHAEYLKPIFPELHEELLNVKKILSVEKKKYEATKQKTKEIISRVLQKELKTKDLVELYDSNGINPEIIKIEAQKQGKKIKIPSNFYKLVAERHKVEEQETQTEREEKLDLAGIPETTCTYFGDWKKTEFRAQVIKIIDNNVILSKTCFYPVSGGQMHDTGTLAGIPVIDVYKQGPHIVHVLQEKPKFTEGETIIGKINFERRKQLTQHHTATHIINAAARTILGNHINQASAKKETDKAYLDVTHYDSISEEEIKKIEKEANKIVEKSIPIKLEFMPRSDAEKKYGMRLYQGGAVPGKQIRIVEIPGIDVEACGGTHLNNTSEAGNIKIIKTTKIKDGVVRIIFTAGKAALEKEQEQDALLSRISQLLEVKEKEIPYRAEELFQKWKIARKAATKKKKINTKELEMHIKKEYTGNIIKKTSEIVKSQPAHLEKTLIKFKKELEEFKKKIQSL